MRTLSAVDAISPAWSHTQRLLDAPRNWRLMLKIGAVAVFAQMGGCNFSGRTPGHFPGGGGGGLGSHVPMSLPFAAIAASVIVLLGLVVLLLSLFFFWVGSRLQFVLFDVVLRRDTTVGPIWSRYGRATWHWMGLKVLVFVVAMLVVSPLIIPGVLVLARSVGSTLASGGDIPPEKLGVFFASIVGFFATILVAIFLIAVAQSLLHDFGLPSMALESTGFGETLARIWRLMKAEPLQVFLYLLLKFLLTVALGIGGEIAAGIVVLIALLPLGGLGAILFFSLHKGGPGAIVLMVLGFVVLGVMMLALLFVLAFLIFGYLYTFLQAYALYFLGGRYPVLGEILEPTPVEPPQGYWGVAPPPVWEPPVV